MNNTRSRGYLWLSILILLLLLLLLLWGTHRGRCSQQLVSDSIAVEQADSIPVRSYTDNRQRPHQVQQSSPSTESSRPNDNAEQHEETSMRPVFAEPKPFVFELNSADTNDLKELRGIGSYFAKAIVRYRDQLGGFQSQEQLLEVPGMTPERYHKALSNAVCKVDCSQCRRLNVNSASLQELKRHPYLDYWQAKGIVQLREKGIRYSTPDDLLQVSTMDTATLRRLKPYIVF